MKWSLTVDTQPASNWKPIEHADHMISLGSCFSQEMGDKMQSCGMRIINNPFGILYNPNSIERSITRLLSGSPYVEDDLFEHQDLFASLDHHSDFTGVNRDDVLLGINQAIDQGSKALAQASTIFVTFGTSFYYVNKADHKVVANCHKLPAQNFERHMQTTDEIVRSYSGLIRELKDSNPNAQWLFTVSPVRHWKDGAKDNQWSKSRLICAVRELENTFDHVHYFPSYEIMMDELRDHRFYKEDLLHPSEQAIDFIWDRFSKSHFSKDTKALNKSITKIQQRLTHRALRPDSAEHQAFLKETGQLVQEMERRLDYVSFESS